MDFSDIERILELVRVQDLAEFALERDGLKLRVRKAGAPPTFHAPMHMQMMPAAAPPAAPPAIAAPPVAAPVSSSAGVGSGPADADVESVELAVVKSPIVGTFYRSAEPGAGAFVDIGDRVKKDQVLCIIEAMKLMNEIEAEVGGEIVKIHHENGQPVQFGEPLFSIRTTP